MAGSVAVAVAGAGTGSVTGSVIRTLLPRGPFAGSVLSLFLLLSGIPASGRPLWVRAVLGGAAGKERILEKGFHVYEAALRLVKLLGPLHEEVRKSDRDLAGQLRRAGSSILLNLAEGAGRRGRDRIHFYRIALGSAREVRAALDVARAWNAIGSSPEVDGPLDRVCAMLWRLTRGPGR